MIIVTVHFYRILREPRGPFLERNSLKIIEGNAKECFLVALRIFIEHNIAFASMKV